MRLQSIYYYISNIKISITIQVILKKKHKDLNNTWHDCDR